MAKYKCILQYACKVMTVILLGVTTFSSFSVAQQDEPKTILDSRRYDAWSIEYEPYRLLIENAFEEYRALTGDDIPRIMPADMIITIRSKTGKQEIFQIRYGTPANGFTIIEGQKVNWILGATLVKTIYDKDNYYNLDTSIPFTQAAIQPELDYLQSALFWPRVDLLISLSQSIYRFGNYGGVFFEWGNEQVGRPYGEAGYMRLGIGTPVFKIGLQMPSIINVPNGYAFADSAYNILNGGWGGFGAFNFSNLYGEFSFLSNNGSMSFDPTVNITGVDFINYSDLSGLLFLNLGFPLGKGGGAFQIKPGVAFERIAHRKIVGEELRSRLIDRAGNPYSFDETYYFGFYLRADYVTNITTEGVPKLYSGIQIAGGTSVVLKVMYNINTVIGIPVLFTYYMSEEDWQPQQSIRIGVRFRFDNPMQ